MFKPKNSEISSYCDTLQMSTDIYLKQNLNTDSMISFDPYSRILEKISEEVDFRMFEKQLFVDLDNL